MITSIQRGLKEDGYEVSISQLCRWFDVPRRTVYYRPTKSAPKLAGGKSAVERLTRVAAVEAGALQSGIRVNCLYPGIIATDMQEKLQTDLVAMGAFPDKGAISEHVVAKTPLRRVGTPEDVAQAAAYLCSDYAGFITGVGLPVDGGMALG